MHIILLSGGSGMRLWPLSNDIRSKQFIKIFKNPEGNAESMLQRVYRQICSQVPEAQITVATSKNQVSAIRSQLPESVSICVEPCRKDTFPAVTLAVSYLHDVCGVSEQECIVVCPVDSYVEDSYFRQLLCLKEMVENGNENLTLVGIEPTYPSAKYGYIIPETQGQSGRVGLFHEKPDEETAGRYISQGALWNGGIFAFRLGYMLEKAHEQISFSDYAELYAIYDTVKSQAFDHAVVEGEKKLSYLRYPGAWKALGTWNTFAESMEIEKVGHAIFDESCSHVHVVNELNVPIVCMGLSDVIVSASPEGILISDKRKSSNIKPYIEQIDQRVMFGEKSWGSFRVLDLDENSMTVKILLRAGHHMNYHSHDHRDEVWTVISGKGKTIVDGMEQQIRTGDVITMQAGCRHTVIARTELQLIEVQLGKEINVHDKRKYEYEF